MALVYLRSPEQPLHLLQVNQRSQAELNRVMPPEPEVPAVDPALFVDAELAAKKPRDRRRREGFSFVQKGKLQRQAEVQRLRVRCTPPQTLALRS